MFWRLWGALKVPLIVARYTKVRSSGPRLGLGGRFALLTALVLAVAFTLSALFSINERNQLLREDLLEEGRLLGRFVALVSPEAILAHDFETLNDYAREISDHADMVYGVLLDDRGEPLTSHLDRSKPLVARALREVGEERTGELLTRLQGYPEVIPMAFPVRHAGRTLGAVELGLDTGRLDTALRTAWRDHLLRSGVLVILLAIGIALAFRAAVLRKVHRLMEGVERVRDGTLDQPVTITSRDELGDLTQVFNLMIVALAEQRELLTNINAELEQRVTQRTTELDRELSERRHTEEALSRTLRHNTELLENSSEAYIDLDPEWRIHYFNHAAEQLFEQPRERVANGRLWEALPTLAPLCRGRFESALRAREPISFETYSAPLGKWLEVRGYPGEGGMWAFFKEITAAKQARAALAESEERVRSLLDASPDIIQFKDAHGRWVEANPAALALFGLEGRDYKGLTDLELVERVGPEMGETLLSCREGDRRAWEEGRVLREETTIHGADGRRHTFDVVKVPLFFDSGAPKGLVVLARDISERKRMEHALEQSRGAAEAANRAKSDFLATMSHEIRAPMNAIIGMGELLAEEALSPRARDYAGVLTRNGNALLALINDILDLSKVESGCVELEPAPFSLAELLTDAVEAQRGVAEGKGLNLEWQLEQGLAPWREGDSVRLRQILTNLISNAIKFTDHGTVSIAVVGEDAQSVRFAVRDSGIGIAAERQDEIFDAFTQADRFTTRDYGGTGLGLAICRRLVTLMEGRMELESRPGEGSTFRFTLPLPPTDPIVEDDFAPGATGSGRTLRILLVEDSDDNLLLFGTHLKRSPHRVEVARDGREAVDRLEGERFDLVLMDMEMPRLDGYAATREIRARERAEERPHTPIIALTAHALEERLAETLEAGCDEHLTKPISRERLLEAVERFR